MSMPQIGGDSQNTMPVAINAGMAARQIAKTVVTDPNAAKFSMDAFKQSITNPGATAKAIAEATGKNLPLSEALAQQGFIVRLASKIPFVKNFLGADFILNGHIGGLGKDALGGLSKASVTKIALEGGDVAGKLISAGVPKEAAEEIAKKGAERLAAMGGNAVATTAQKAATTVVASAADDLAKQAVGMTMKKGFQAATEEAVKKALSSPNALETLKDLGFYAKDAKALVAKAATSTVETAAKAGATQAAEQVATTGAQAASKGGVKGFFGKLLGGAKGNFIIAGVFSLASNAMQLAQGKMSIPQFLGLTVLDTAAYGAIGWGSAAAGAAIGTALFPGVGSIAGFVIGLGLGFLGGTVYEKFVRNPVKNMLGGTPAGGAEPGAYDPSQYTTQPQQNPYANPAQSTYIPPAPGTEMSYEQALREIDKIGSGGYYAPDHEERPLRPAGGGVFLPWEAQAGATSARRATIASAMRRKAWACGPFGSAIATGSPRSPLWRMAGSRGTSPRKGTPSRSATSRPPPRSKMSVSVPQLPQMKWLMFSTTPRMGACDCWSIRRVFVPIAAATGWGVSTMAAPVSGTSCTKESGMSPVPGGRSTSRKSSSPQATSWKNWRIAPASIGPRHTTGSSGLGSRKPIDMIFTPCASMGTSFSLMTEGLRSGTPIRKGTLGP